MNSSSPYHALSMPWQLLLCIALVAATLGYASGLSRQGKPLEGLLPHGVLSLEVPWSTGKAQALKNRLGEAGIAIARRQVQLDFGFLLLYPLAFSVACALIADRVGGRLGLMGVLASWAVLATAALDALENVAILKMLDSEPRLPWPPLATICAALKFTLLFGAAAFIVVGGLTLAMRCVQRSVS